MHGQYQQWKSRQWILIDQYCVQNPPLYIYAYTAAGIVGVYSSGVWAVYWIQVHQAHMHAGGGRGRNWFCLQWHNVSDTQWSTKRKFGAIEIIITSMRPAFPIVHKCILSCLPAAFLPCVSMLGARTQWREGPSWGWVGGGVCPSLRLHGEAGHPVGGEWEKSN